MPTDKEIQSLITECEDAYEQGNYEFVESKFEQLLKVIEHSGYLRLPIAMIFEKMGKYDTALRIMEKYYDLLLDTHLGSPHRPHDPRWTPSQERVKEFNELKDQSYDIKRRLNWKIAHQNELNYCGLHGEKLLDGMCPRSKKRSHREIYMGEPQEDIECFAVNYLSIIPQFDKSELFSEDPWKIQLIIKNVKDRIYNLKFELELCNYLSFKKCIFSTKDQKVSDVLTLTDDNFLVKEENEVILKKYFEKGDYFLLNLSFRTKSDAESEISVPFHYFLKIKYDDKNKEHTFEDQCLPFRITIYPSLDKLFNKLLEYLRKEKLIDVPVTFQFIRKELEDIFTLKLSKDILSKILNLLQALNAIEYLVDEDREELTITNIHPVQFKSELPPELSEKELETIRPSIPDTIQEKVVIYMVKGDTTEKVEKQDEMNQIKELLIEQRKELGKNKIISKLQIFISKPKELEKYFKKILRSDWDQEKKEIYQEVIIEILDDFIDDKWYEKIGNAIEGIAGKIIGESLVELGKWGFGKLADYLREKN